MVPSEELQRAGLGGGRGKINLKTPWVLILYHCVRLFVTPMDCSSPGSSIHGDFQARILEWVVISSPMFLQFLSKNKRHFFIFT